jgi:hypothetical protein
MNMYRFHKNAAVQPYAKGILVYSANPPSVQSGRMRGIQTGSPLGQQQDHLPMHKWNVIPQTKLEDCMNKPLIQICECTNMHCTTRKITCNSKMGCFESKPCKFFKYRVNVCRIAYGNQYIEVVARNKKEAQRTAEDEAGNLSFTEHTSKYQAQTCQRLEQIQPFMGG